MPGKVEPMPSRLARVSQTSERARREMVLREKVVAGARVVSADRFIGDVAGAAFHAVVNGNLADRAEGFVVIGRNA